jgi:hypothetical protein
MEVFIVRIYRNDTKKDKKNPHSLVGIVENVATEGKKSFRDFDELWEILSSAEDKKGKQVSHI